MLKPIKDSEILKRYTRSSADPPTGSNKQPAGSISVFPNAPLDLPTETFETAMNRRDKNRKTLIQWIQKHLKVDIDYGRIHVVEQCRYARAGVPYLCSDLSHWSMPMLYKAGAERVIGVLGLHANFPNIRDYELACIHKQTISTVILSCELLTSNDTVVAHGTGARNIKQDGFNLNKTIKMACKSALCDAVIRVSGLSGIFIKTHRHTLTKMGDCNKKDVPGMGACNGDNLTATRVCNRHTNQHESIQPKLITQRQKDLILKLAGRFGLTIEALNNRCKDTFGSTLKDLERHHASRFIGELNRQF